jgi:uncharacterized SAM-binding protein YcdF (DUF218 family)
MHHTLEKSDVIMVLGNRDIRIPPYVAKLYHAGFAPVVLFCGSGTIHNHEKGREAFVGSTEAEVFAAIAIENGVPKESIIIENESQNTGENYEFAIKKLQQHSIFPQRIILVQRPFMERRTYATGKVWLPDIELLVTSPDISYENYINEMYPKEYVINTLTGYLQRIKEYPKKGYQIEQEIPDKVWEAYEYLVAQGYNKKLI